MYSRAHPSPRYRALLALYRQMHEEGSPADDLPPEQTFPGTSLFHYVGFIKTLIDRHQAKTLLDYGAGKGLQYRPREIVVDDRRWPSIQAYWGVEQIYCYDPAYAPLAERPRWTFDGVICTDVLEHCPEEDIPWILEEIFSYARRFVFAAVACFPAEKCLPNGENAHCTVRPIHWWEAQLHRLRPRVPFEFVFVSTEGGRVYYDYLSYKGEAVTR